MNTLTPLGIAVPDPFPAHEAPTPGHNELVHRGTSVIRRWAALPADDQRFIEHILDCIERRNINDAARTTNAQKP